MVTGGRHAIHFNQNCLDNGPYSGDCLVIRKLGENHPFAPYPKLDDFDPGKSVELLNPNGSRNCSIKDLPDERVLHSQTWLHTCGGVDVGDGSIKDRASNESSQRVPSSASLPPGC